MINSIDRWIIGRYSRLQSDYMTSYTSGDGYSKHHMSKKIFKELVPVQFEEHDFNAPLLYHEYLSCVYGDYLKLPAPDDRVSPHRVVEMSIEPEIAADWTN